MLHYETETDIEKHKTHCLDKLLDPVGASGRSSVPFSNPNPLLPATVAVIVLAPQHSRKGKSKKMVLNSGIRSWLLRSRLVDHRKTRAEFIHPRAEPAASQLVSSSLGCQRGDKHLSFRKSVIFFSPNLPADSGSIVHRVCACVCAASNRILLVARCCRVGFLGHPVEYQMAIDISGYRNGATP